MAWRTEHRISERAFIPRVIIAATIDKECRRYQGVADLSALYVGLDARLSTLIGLPGYIRIWQGHPQIAGNGDQILLCQRLRTCHQRDVGLPKAVGVFRMLHQLGSPKSNIASS